MVLITGLSLMLVGLPAVTDPSGVRDAPDSALRIIHVDVGQGDATIIVGPGAPGERRSLLIDSGDIPNRGSHIDGGLRVIQSLRKLGVSRLDYVVLTHFDSDHVGGFAAGSRLGHSVLLGEDNAPGVAGVDDDGDGVTDWLDEDHVLPDREEMGQGDDLYSPTTLFIDRGDAGGRDTKSNRSYRALANPQRRHSVTSASQVGRELALGGGATATVVCGNGYVIGRMQRVPLVNTENERSVGVLVSYGKFDYLVCGDLIGRRAGSENANVEEPLADALIERGVLLEALHVNHHGAANATRVEAIQKLRPTVGIISVGARNRYGHPASSTLTHLFAQGTRVYQTESGARWQVAGQGSSTVLGGHILLEARADHFHIRNWGSLGSVAISHRYRCRDAE